MAVIANWIRFASIAEKALTFKTKLDKRLELAVAWTRIRISWYLTSNPDGQQRIVKQPFNAEDLVISCHDCYLREHANHQVWQIAFDFGGCP